MEAIMDGITEHLRDSIVLIERFRNGEAENGTGFLVRRNRNVYLITCEHIAVEMIDRGGTIRFIRVGHPQLSLQDVELIGRNARADVAVFHVLRPLERSESILSYDLIHVANHLCVHDGKLIGVFGYPSALGTVGARGRREYPPAATITRFLPGRAIFRLSAYLEYQSGANTHREVRERRDLILPEAFGYSGSPIIVIEQGSPGQLWTPTMCKIIGIQFATKRRRWIRFSSVKYADDIIVRHDSRHSAGSA